MPNMYGPLIKTVRLQKGIKAVFVAHKIGISRSTYSQIESGELGLSAERLHKILAVLEVTMSEFAAMTSGMRYRRGKSERDKGGERYAM